MAKTKNKKKLKIPNNLKTIVIKFAIFIALFIGVRFFINAYFALLPFYSNLVIPPDFKPVFSGMIATTGLVVAIAFALINKEKLKSMRVPKTKLRDSIIFGILTPVVIAIYYIIRYWIHNNLDLALSLTYLFIPVLYLFIIGFPLMLFIAVFGTDFIKEIYLAFKKQWKYYTGGGLLVYFVLIGVQSLWRYFSSGVAKSLEWTFSIFYDQVYSAARTSGPYLRIEGFGAIIGSACSGIDSFFLFTALFFFIFLLDYKKIDKKRMLLLFPIGVVGMYISNIIRIFLLYLTGIYVSPKFAIGMFHQNIGWVVFIIYFTLFWWIASKFVYLKKPKTAKKPAKKKK